MKKLLLVLISATLLLTVFGCSQDPVSPTPTGDQIALVQRPEFVDQRPDSEIAAATIRPTVEYNYQDKKKPVPDPDPEPEGDDPNPNPAHKYAYIVGISDYEGTANDLSYCDDDAADMKAYLQSQGFQCRVDTDLSATADAIGAGLDWLVSVAAPGDEVAFCYSGHGSDTSDYDACLISADLYYVTQGFVMEKFNAINCTKKLMTIDACQVGDFHDLIQTGTLMCTASDRSYSYDAPEFQNGAWTHFWLEAAEDLAIVFGEPIADYANAEMKAWAKTAHLRATPKYTDMYDGSFDI